MKVYEAVAAGLVEEGVTTMFGVMGDGNMSLWGTLGRAGIVRMISAGNEAAAVAMADAYSRSGKVGVATVTCGPGLTQVGTSLMAAARNRSQLVLVVGQAPRGAKNASQSMDQRRFAEACEARFVDVSSMDNLPDEMAEAFYAARVHRGPVVLNLDMALQERSFDWDFSYRPSTAFLPPPVGAPSPEAIAPVLDKLISAQRPVIIAGIGAVNAKHELLRLGEQVGAVLATSLQAKGLFSGEEFDLGISGSYACAAAEGLFAEADFVLAVGAELGYYTAEGGLMFPVAEVARIDIKPAPPEIGVLPGLYLCGDAKKTVALLADTLLSRKVTKPGYRTAETRALLEQPTPVFPSAPDGMDPRELARQIGASLPQDGCLLTLGAGHFSAFPSMYMSQPQGAVTRMSYHFSAIGQTLPFAIGAAAAHPGLPHIAIEGDGSMLMNLQELFTIARYRMQLVLIVWNDGGFGAEVHKLKVKGFDPALAQWDSADFVALARAFGGDGIRVERESAVRSAIEQGLQRGGLFLIDARVSPSIVSDAYSKVHLGKPNGAPLLRPPGGAR